MPAFLCLEKFWIKSIITALITAVILLVLVLILVRPKIEELQKDAERRKELLSMEHADLSKDLTEGITNILNRVAELKQSLAELKQSLEFLQAAQFKDEGRVEQTRDPAFDLYDRELFIEDLELKVLRLEAENQSLCQENQQLREQISCSNDIPFGGKYGLRK